MGLSLFDLSVEFYALKDMVDNDLEYDQETGEIIDNSNEIKQLFDELNMTLEDKLDNTQRYLLTLQGEQDILDKEIKRLQTKKSALKNKEDRLKKLILSALEVSGKSKFKTSLYSFSIRNTKSVEIINIDDVPRNFLRVKYEADKKKIGDELKAGASFDFAKIVENKSLGVK